MGIIQDTQITGTNFKNGIFQDEITCKIPDDIFTSLDNIIEFGDNNLWFGCLYNGYSEDKEFPQYKNTPRYITYFCHDGFNLEYYFMDSLKEVNLFLKEMQPLVDVIKYIETK